MLELRVSDLRKSYDGLHDVCKRLSFNVNDAEIAALSGRNGAGKSTVMKMIAGVLQSTGGSIQLLRNGKIVSAEERQSSVGFVSPYLQLYEEFSLWEHCCLDAELRGRHFESEDVEHLIRLFGLWERKDNLLRTYSSGMKQRAKMIVALWHRPQLLLVDEPTTNVDEAGVETIYRCLHDRNLCPGIRIVATNELRDLQQCSMTIPIQ